MIEMQKCKFKKKVKDPKFGDEEYRLVAYLPIQFVKMGLKFRTKENNKKWNEGYEIIKVYKDKIIYEEVK